jgi:cyclohexadienyl dehydratase
MSATWGKNDRMTMPDQSLNMHSFQQLQTGIVLFSARLLAIGCLSLLISGTAQANADRLQRIEENHKLRVCIWPDYYGISFRNPKTQQLSGIDVDNARDLASDLGVSVEFVDSSFATLIDDVTNDRCDIAMFAIGITPIRQKRLRFTPPHLASDIYAITTRGNRRIRNWEDLDKPGNVIAVARGTLHERIMAERLQAAELRVLDTPQAREQEVQSGQADAFMTDYPFSRRMLHSNDWARLVSPPTPYHITPYAWALAPGDDRFYLRVTNFLASIKHDGRLLRNARRNELEPIVVP